MIVHPPNVLPLPLEEGFDVAPGFSVSLGVRPKRNVRVGAPYGDCVDHNPLFNATGNGDHVTYRQVVCQQMCTQDHVSKVGWIAFNGTFSTNRLYCALSIQEFNPITYVLYGDGRTRSRTPVLPLSKQVLQQFGYRGRPRQ